MRAYHHTYMMAAIKSKKLELAKIFPIVNGWIQYIKWFMCRWKYVAIKRGSIRMKMGITKWGTLTSDFNKGASTTYGHEDNLLHLHHRFCGKLCGCHPQVLACTVACKHHISSNCSYPSVGKDLSDSEEGFDFDIKLQNAIINWIVYLLIIEDRMLSHAIRLCKGQFLKCFKYYAENRMSTHALSLQGVSILICQTSTNGWLYRKIMLVFPHFRYVC